jgi:glycosyltransferase 2 family protein
MKAPLLKTLLKLLISVGIIGILIYTLKPEHLYETLKNLSLWKLGVALLAYFVCQGISAFKWLQLARSMKIGGTFPQYYRFYMLGMFFGLFLPTSVGGDVGRAMLLAKEESTRWTQAFLSILAERGTGLCALMVYAIIGMLVVHPTYHFASAFITVLGFSIFTLSVTFGFHWIEHHPWGHRLIQKLVHKPEDESSDTFYIWPQNKTLVLAVGYSLLFHTGLIWMQWFILQDLGGNASFLLVAVIYAMSGLLSLLPISLNGIGVREASTTSLLFYWGHIPHEIGGAYSLVWLSVMLLTTIPGALLALQRQLLLPTRKKI